MRVWTGEGWEVAEIEGWGRALALGLYGRKERIGGEGENKRSGGGESITYTTMGAICPTALLGCLIHLDVLDDQVPCVEPLGVGVGFGVLEQAQQELGGFFRPPRFRYAELFACVGDGCQLGMLEGRGWRCEIVRWWCSKRFCFGEVGCGA